MFVSIPNSCSWLNAEDLTLPAFHFPSASSSGCSPQEKHVHWSSWSRPEESSQISYPLQSKYYVHVYTLVDVEVVVCMHLSECGLGDCSIVCVHVRKSDGEDPCT